MILIGSDVDFHGAGGHTFPVHVQGNFLYQVLEIDRILLVAAIDSLLGYETEYDLGWQSVGPNVLPDE